MVLFTKYLCKGQVWKKIVIMPPQLGIVSKSKKTTLLSIWFFFLNAKSLAWPFVNLDHFYYLSLNLRRQNFWNFKIKLKRLPLINFNCISIWLLSRTAFMAKWLPTPPNLNSTRIHSLHEKRKNHSGTWRALINREFFSWLCFTILHVLLFFLMQLRLW